MRVAAFGRTSLLFEGIKRCKERGHAIVAIGSAVESPDATVGVDDFRALASELDCPFFTSKTLKDGGSYESLRSAAADVAISVNWPTIVGREIQSLFPHGVLNAHAGDLPRYRGNACANWAILQDEPEVVVTIHEMDEGLDTGAVYLKRRLPLTPRTYIGDVYRWLEDCVPVMFADTLDLIAAGVRPDVQSGDALRGLPRRPTDGAIDWQEPAARLDRLVRACAEPFQGAYTVLDGQRLTVWRAYPEALPYSHIGVPGQVVSIDRSIGTVTVLAGEGALVIEEIQWQGTGRVPAASVIRSTRTRLGLSFGDLLEFYISRSASSGTQR